MFVCPPSCLSCLLEGFHFPAQLSCLFVWPWLGSHHKLTDSLVTARDDEHAECLQPVQKLSPTWRNWSISYGSHSALNANLSVPTAPLTPQCMANLFIVFRTVCAINLKQPLKYDWLRRSQWIHGKFGPSLLTSTKEKKNNPPTPSMKTT